MASPRPPRCADGLRVAADNSWSDLFSRLLAAKVEPNLGLGRPTILCEYPASEAALARLSRDDPRVAERFELYACGVELANAFGELTDPAEQRRRFEEDMALKAESMGRAIRSTKISSAACLTCGRRAAPRSDSTAS